MEIILTDEEKRSYENQEYCHICNEKFCYDEDDEEFKKNPQSKRSLSFHGKIWRSCK